MTESLLLHRRSDPGWLEKARLAVRAIAERERREQFHTRLSVKPFKHGPLPEPRHKPRGTK